MQNGDFSWFQDNTRRVWSLLLFASLSTLKRNYGYIIGIRAVAGALMFAAQMLPARILSIEDYGVFAYLNSMLVILTLLVVWGTDKYCLRETSLIREDGIRSSSPGGPPAAVYMVLGINTLAVSVCLRLWLPRVMGDNYTHWIFLACVIIVLFRSIILVTTSISKGHDRVVAAEIVLNILRPLLFVVPLLLVLAASAVASLDTLLNMLGASFIVAVIISVLTNGRSGVRVAGTRHSVCSVYRTSFNFLLVGIGIPLAANICTLQLGHLRPREDVALYGASVKIVSLVLLALVSANQLIAPKLAPLFRRGDIQGMRKLIRGNNAFVFILTVIPIAFIACFAEGILSILGDRYSAASPLLRALMIGQAFSVICGPVVLTSTLIGLQKTAATVVLSSCVMIWLLCLLLIPWLGTMGAVYASVVGSVTMNSVLAVFIYVRTGLNVTMLNLLRSRGNESAK